MTVHRVHDVDRGVFRRARLVEELGRRQFDALVGAGQLRRLAQGWYADAAADPSVERAVALGGQLSCLSALDLHGVWAPGRELHVAVRRRPSSTHQSPPGVVLHSVRELAWASAMAPVSEALIQAVRHHDAESVLMVAESAANLGLVGVAEVEEILATANRRKQWMLQHFDPRAEAGSETRLRIFFRERGASVRAQPQLTPDLRSDLLVGRSWVIEADSQTYHGSSSDRMRDLERDLTLTRLGYRVTRLSYAQIFHTWEDTKRALSGILRTRQHQRAPMPVDMPGELQESPASRPW